MKKLILALCLLAGPAVAAPGGPGSVLVIDTLAHMTGLSATVLTTNPDIYLLGYTAAGDGGGGFFHYNSASSATANAGTVFAPSAGSGRLLRQFTSPLNFAFWGVTTGGTAAANNTAINAAISSGLCGQIYLNSGTYNIQGGLVFPRCLSPVGYGGQVSVFNQDSGSCAASFMLERNDATGDTNIRGETMHDFGITSSCSTGSTNGLVTFQFGNGDAIAAVYIQGVKGSCFQMTNFYDLDMHGNTAVLCGGNGYNLLAAPTGSQTVFNMNAGRFNGGDGLFVNNPLGFTLSGGDFSGNSGYNIHVTGGYGFVDTGSYCEDITATGQRCVYVDGGADGVDLTVTWGDGTAVFGRTLIEAAGAAQRVVVRRIIAPGPSVNGSDKSVVFSSCGDCVAHAPGFMGYTNAGSTNRIYLPPKYETGVSAYSTVAQSAISVGSPVVVNFATVAGSSNQKGEWSTNAFTPADPDFYTCSGSVPVTYSSDTSPLLNVVTLQMWDNTGGSSIGTQPVAVGVVTGTTLPFNFTSQGTLDTTHSYSIRLQYVAGGGTPTVNIPATQNTTQIYCRRSIATN